MQTYIGKGSLAYRRALIALFFGSLTTFSILYCTQPLLPLYSNEFSLSPSFASLSLSLPTAAMAISMLFVAGLSDRIGRKKTMMLALCCSSLLTLAAAASNGFTQLLLFRSLQGFFLAGFPPIAMAYINEEFNPEISGLAMGIYISGTSLGGLFGRLTVSFTADHFSWQTALFSLGCITLSLSLLFCLTLPHERRLTPSTQSFSSQTSTLLTLLADKHLLRLYTVGFALIGSFVAIYNYIGYPLLKEPYNLSQSTIGGLFLLYLVGAFSSPYMGRQADKIGHGSVICQSLLLMLVGALTTLFTPLFCKIAGLAVFTFGFFGGHAAISSWIGKSCPTHKAQASSLYLFFYYLGASILGVGGGFFLRNFDWPGVIAMISCILCLALVIAKNLHQNEKSNDSSRTPA